MINPRAHLRSSAQLPLPPPLPSTLQSGSCVPQENEINGWEEIVSGSNRNRCRFKAAARRTRKLLLLPPPPAASAPLIRSAEAGDSDTLALAHESSAIGRRQRTRRRPGAPLAVSEGPFVRRAQCSAHTRKGLSPLAIFFGGVGGGGLDTRD